MLTEFLSIIGSIVAGGTLFSEHCEKSNITKTNKSNAMRNNETTYYDGNNKLRSTQTNEQVHIRFMNGGYTKYIGLHSNTVYKNTLNKRNAELKGKKYIYKEYPRDKLSTELWKYDTEKKMPFKVTDHIPNLLFDGYIEIRYYPELDEYGGVDLFHNSFSQRIEHSNPEYKAYL